MVRGPPDRFDFWNSTKRFGGRRLRHRGNRGTRSRVGGKCDGLGLETAGGMDLQRGLLGGDAGRVRSRG